LDAEDDDGLHWQAITPPQAKFVLGEQLTHLVIGACLQLAMQQTVIAVLILCLPDEIGAARHRRQRVCAFARSPRQIIPGAMSAKKPSCARVSSRLSA
jgi:hypothetical protein